VPVVDVDGAVDVVRVLEHLWVGALDVVGLVEGIDTGLPVAVDLEGEVEIDLEVLEVVGVEVQGDHAQVVL
jgi:hypothetical protein